MIETWLVSVVDFFGLVFETLARIPKYQSRVTLIVYGTRANSIVGVHWISYAGSLTPHRKTQEFDNKSIGYQVLTDQVASPYFTTSDKATQSGQKRGETVNRPFITFRLNRSAILSLDWPETLDADDPYVELARNFFNTNIAPVVGEVLDKWPTPLPAVVGLQPLP
jgi:hypothetical protein